MVRWRREPSRQEVYGQLLDRFREEHARASKSPEWKALEAELEARGIDATDFGIFSSVAPTTFDAEAAAPLLVEWLPRMRDSVEKEVIARSLTGTKTAAPAAARAILVEFRSAPMDDETTKWAYGNALATLADAGVADDLIELLGDPRHGQRPRDALRRLEADKGSARARCPDRADRRRRDLWARDLRAQELWAEERPSASSACTTEARRRPQTTKRNRPREAASG